MEAFDINSIPQEKFEFVADRDIMHDKPLETKHVGYLRDAFRRFRRNKGSVVAAVIILLLVLFAIIVPFCTQYSVSYTDQMYYCAMPYNKAFENTSFWDGCKEVTQGKKTTRVFYAMGEESGHNAIKNQEYTVDDGNYTYRLNSIHKVGVIYKTLTPSEYEAIQEYQDKHDVQIIYPMVPTANRPTDATDKLDANYYFVTRSKGGKTEIVYGDDGWSITPAYGKYLVGETTNDGYTSKMRIEGDEGVTIDGEKYYYTYSRIAGAGYEVRVNYYEYYKYYHAEIARDGIKEPKFLLGCDSLGHDILTCLSSGARFSFIFAIVVAVVNMLVGAIYGSIEGYYGGKRDLIMERISDILSAIPMMIVITLLKYHMGGASHILVLFLSFFLTGWIGMASTTRMQFYRFKNQEYVLAARTLGAKDRRLMFKHIFPNAIGTLVTSCALVIPSMIYSEVSLTYLGIINLSTGNITSVGTLISSGQAVMSTFPHVALFPSLFLMLLMLSFNLFGNGLRDAFNPSLRGSEG